VEAFCKAFAASLAKRAPQRFTATMAKRQRRGRIYLDWVRNTRGATAVAAYSLRARPGLPASTPLAWSELLELDDPRELSFATVPARLEAAAADPWATIEDAARSLTKEMQHALGIRA
jgi:bifunctional non-homologous end joining protein LigD